MNQDNNTPQFTREMPFKDAQGEYVDNLVERCTRRAINGAAKRQVAKRNNTWQWLATGAAACVAVVAVAVAIFSTGSSDSTVQGGLIAQSTTTDTLRDEFGFTTIDYDEVTVDEPIAADATDEGPLDKFINTLDDSDLASLDSEYDSDYDFDEEYF